MSAFDRETVFDGGFTLRPLVAKSTGGEHEFLNSGIERVAATIRDIRNALSHGREQKSRDVILPTSGNFEKLRPWVALVQVAAQEVMVYRHIV